MAKLSESEETNDQKEFKSKNTWRLNCQNSKSSDILYSCNRKPYGAVQQYFENVENQAKSWFKKVNAIAKNESIYEVKTDILTAATSIIDALIKYAFNTSIDIIVIGTRGRTGIKRLLLGRVAHGIVQHAHCPVLLVR